MSMNILLTSWFSTYFKWTLVSEYVNQTEGYQFKVTIGSSNTDLFYSANGNTLNNFKLSQLGTNLYSINENYTASVALKKNGVWNSFGPPTVISTFATSKVADFQCAAIVTSLGNYFVNIDKVIGTYVYRITINNGESNYVITTSNTYFNFSSLPTDFKKQASSFIITVETKGLNGVYAAGPSCTLTVPTPIKTTVNDPITITKLKDFQCGNAITSLATGLVAYPVTGATSYRFEVANGGNVEVVTTTTPSFSLSQLITFPATVNNSYSIRVAAYSNNTWGNYGDTCSINTPIINIQYSQCGTTLATISTVVYATSVSGATSYTFSVANLGEFISSTRSFHLTDVGNINYSTTYNIKVAVTSNGVTSPFGTVCSITTPAAPIPVPPIVNSSTQTFCSGAIVNNLAATGTLLKWYTDATGGTALAKTDILSSRTYFVSQTLNGFESIRVSVNVIINFTPAPDPLALGQSFCHGATIADLSALGSNIQWYANPTGGYALSSSTILATKNYYESQTINGCQSTRTAVPVTITISTAPLAKYQLFTYAATVADLVATGTNIKWYSSLTGGSPLEGTALLVNGTTHYYCSQTINGCESTRTVIYVRVLIRVALVDNATNSTIAKTETTPTEFTIYPNPVSNILSIQTSNDSTIDKVVVIDLYGKVILEETPINNQIKVEQFPTGTYIIQISSGEEKFLTKFIKE